MAIKIIFSRLFSGYFVLSERKLRSLALEKLVKRLRMFLLFGKEAGSIRTGHSVQDARSSGAANGLSINYNKVMAEAVTEFLLYVIELSRIGVLPLLHLPVGFGKWLKQKKFALTP